MGGCCEANAEKPNEVQKAKYSKRVIIKSILERTDGGVGLIGQCMTIGGWVKTGREQGKGTFAFLEVNDGSCFANLQVLVDASVGPLSELTPTGTCILAEGELKKPPEGTKQKVEFKVAKIREIGTCNPSTYPIAKTRLPLEFLRGHLHLRARTNTIAAVARIRNALAYAIHTFFQQNGFLYVHTPIITTSDCEGAGEMFQVTTLFNEAERRDKEAQANPPPSEAELQEAKNAVTLKGEALKELKKGGNKEIIGAAVQELKQAKELVAQLEARSKFQPGMPKKDGAVDYSADFFSRQAYLTVSGQLQVETYACGLSSVYTFGPTFRAENSHTTRHLAEFWMIEPEIAFADLEVRQFYVGKGRTW